MSDAYRRRFLQFLAASPIAGTAWAQLSPKQRLPDPIPWAALEPDKLIKSPKEAINVFDFEPAARSGAPIAKASSSSSCGRGAWSTSRRST